MRAAAAHREVEAGGERGPFVEEPERYDEPPLDDEHRSLAQAVRDAVQEAEVGELPVLMAEFGDVEHVVVRVLRAPADPPLTRHDERGDDGAGPGQCVRGRPHAVRVTVGEEPYADALDGRQRAQRLRGDEAVQAPGEGVRRLPAVVGAERQEGADARDDVVGEEGALAGRAQDVVAVQEFQRVALGSRPRGAGPVPGRPERIRW